MIRRLTVFIATLVLLAPAIAWAKPPLWVAHGPGATITLFGSVHVLPHDLDWEPDGLKTALAEADQLWFETPIDPATLLGVTQLALKKGMLPQGKSLYDLLSKNGKARLRRQETALHLPGPELEHLRPWLAELTLADAAYARDGATADEGVERQLSDSAPQAERHAFETPAQQIDMFSGGSVAVQVKSLQDTLRDLEEDPDQARRLIDAWLKSDMKAIDKEGVQALRDESAQMFAVVLTNRNAAWVRTLMPLLQTPPPAGGRPLNIVVVVGVGHLAGKDGVPELLRRKGIRVDGPQY